MQAERALEELIDTEGAYVRDLGVLCELKHTVVARKICDPATTTSIFANLDALRGINTELYAALRGEDAPESTDALQRVSTAFSTLAPYLRAYATYCTQAITSHERVKTLRVANAALDQALGEAEQQTGQSIGSWLIRPVQRLCKYPLLLNSLVKQVPEGSSAHSSLQLATEAIQGVVNDVNERVREAEEREGLLVLAEALGRRDLITPQRSLLLSVCCSRWIETHSSGVIGIESEVQRLQRLDADRQAVRAQHRAAVWLCSDLLMMGRPKGSSYTLLEQTAVHLTTIEPVEPERSVVRLMCETGAVYLLELAPDDAHMLMVALASARERAAESSKIRARGALGELAARKVGERGGGAKAAAEAAGATASAHNGQQHAHFSASVRLKERRAPRGVASELTEVDMRDELSASSRAGSLSSRHESISKRSFGSWTLRLRLRMSAAARELSAGSFGKRSHKRTGSASSADAQPTADVSAASSQVETLLPDAKSRRRSEPDGLRRSASEDVSALLHIASTGSTSAPPPPPPPPLPPSTASHVTPVRDSTVDERRQLAAVLGRLPHAKSGIVEAMHVDQGSGAHNPASAAASLPPRRHVLRDLVRTAEGSGDAFHEELLLALRRRAAAS